MALNPEQVESAERLAAELMADAEARRRPAERRQAARMARLLGDPEGRAMIMALTDEVLRIREPSRAAAVLSELVTSGGHLLDDWRHASFLAAPDRVALMAGGRLARALPRAVVPLVRARVKKEMSGVILPAGRRRLARHAARRRAQHIRLNVNVLGEAVLGEDEARRRLDKVLATLESPAVDYVSVKISSVCSQLDVLAFDAEVDRIAERLRVLYWAAGRHDPAKFVNLDMEEYRDLDLTVEVFKKVLDEREFRHTDAGIVLQAYLPDSFAVLEDLCGWADARRRAGGGWIKVRIVKGANLAMETVDAEWHGWPRAPFATKDQTDANYKRMVDVALASESVRLGVASHNLFEIAWAAVVAEAAGAADRVEFEMLEGMSPAAAEAVAARFGGLLLYAPVVERSELEAAIAYLVRRLDENSGPDNFIAHQFAMTVGSPAWQAEADRFRRSVAAAADGPRPEANRRQDRSRDEPAGAGPFANAPDTDFTRAPNRAWVAARLHRVLDEGLPHYGPVVNGLPASDPATQDGIDPSRGGRLGYRWAPASLETVEAAVAEARRGQADWWATDRAGILRGAAGALERARGRLLAVMAVDAGKTVGEGDPEVSEAVDFASYYAEHIPEPSSGFRPYGTVVVAAPWNFPLSIPAGGVLAALAAGNTVILKPAPETVATAGELVRALWDAGVPESVLHFAPCLDGDASRRLITHPDVDAVVLTGSWETARMFLDWRPDLNLHAETSGKNAIVVTATADPDQAIADIIHSAFGHAGQKCSAASLAILEAAVHDDKRFLPRLADAVRSMRVGPAAHPTTVIGPVIRPPAGPLAEALTRLEPGERWLVEPELLDRSGYLWRPGVKLGVQAGSMFHLTECFGPVLGIMRADDLDHALALQNQPAYGLTAGLQALDPLEIDHWRARVQAGNLYVNRGITGAIVRRQPFGGWKRSVVGPGAKAGGPNYVASLGTWPTGGSATAADYEGAWRAMAVPADESGLVSEANVFRYRPLTRVAVWGTDGIEQARLAAAAVGCRIADGGDVDKIRVLDQARLAEAHRTGLWVDATPVAADPRRELLRWVREQAVSESRHRHGNVTGRRPGLLPPPA